MAMYFGLYAECGPNQSDAEALMDHFRGFRITMADGLETTCRSWTNQYREGAWWAEVWPQGLSYSSPHGDRKEIRDDIHATEIGLTLYKHLRLSESFRYAIVGWEADEFRSYNEFDSEDFEILDGLVLLTEMWNQHGRTRNYVEFSPGYMWNPWRGLPYRRESA